MVKMTSVPPKCQVCLDLDIKVLNGSRSCQFDEFKAAASNGCSICSVVLEGIEKWTKEIGLAETLKGNVQKVTIRVNGSHILVAELSCDGRNGDPKPLELEFYNHQGATSLWSKLRPTIHMPQESKWDLDTSTRWIEQQLLHCDKNHPDCKGDHEELSILPTRVLDLGENLGNASIRLHQTNNSFGVYATLSHCWGPVQPLTTTHDTYSQRLQGIALKELPNTFRDAVMVARKLGIRYLWIDSLCIIQGDKTDWEIESSRMAGVFGNAYVNLAASSSRDSRGGLFREGRSRYLGIEREDEGGINNRVYVRLGLDAGHRSCLHFWVHSLSTPPLGRAWVYQERVLSKRFVQFTNSELVWECNASITCECGNPLLKHCTFLH